MSKDYAKYIPEAKEKSRKPASRFEIWVVIGMSCLVALAIVIACVQKIGQPFFANSLQRFKMLVSPQAVQPAAKPVPVMNSNVQFEFYHDAAHPAPSRVEAEKTDKIDEALKSLPHQSAPLAAAPLRKPTYVLELGTFKNEISANQMRISLLLLGVDADLEKTTENNETVYQLYYGSYPNENAAIVAQKRLEKKGIVGNVKKW